MQQWPTHKNLLAIIQQLDPAAHLNGVHKLCGGVSALVFKLDIVTADDRQEALLLRRHQGDNAARKYKKETALLRQLAASRLPVARLRLDAYPVMLLDFIAGAPDFDPVDRAHHARMSADLLAQIHGLIVDDSLRNSLPRRTNNTAIPAIRSAPNHADYTLEKRIHDALNAHWPPQNLNRSALLHGDFWTGNLIWNAGKIVAIIDWEDAAWGDPLADLAISRLEWTWAFSIECAQMFTDQYRTRRPDLIYDALPIWDLWAALRPFGNFSAWAADWPQLGRPDVTAAAVRARHRDFVEIALADL